MLILPLHARRIPAHIKYSFVALHDAIMYYLSINLKHCPKHKVFSSHEAVRKEGRET